MYTYLDSDMRAGAAGSCRLNIEIFIIIHPVGEGLSGGLLYTGAQRTRADATLPSELYGSAAPRTRSERNVPSLSIYINTLSFAATDVIWNQG